MAGLFDLDIDMSSADAGLPRDKFKDGMRVRLVGNAVTRRLVLPMLDGSLYVFNDGLDTVSIRRGPAIPVYVGRGEWVHIMVDGARGRMWKV